MKRLDQRLAELEKRRATAKAEPWLFLETCDGKTFSGEDGTSYTEDDLSELQRRYRVLIIDLSAGEGGLDELPF